MTCYLPYVITCYTISRPCKGYNPFHRKFQVIVLQKIKQNRDSTTGFYSPSQFDLPLNHESQTAGVRMEDIKMVYKNEIQKQYLAISRKTPNQIFQSTMLWKLCLVKPQYSNDDIECLFLDTYKTAEALRSKALRN